MPVVSPLPPPPGLSCGSQISTGFDALAAMAIARAAQSSGSYIGSAKSPSRRRISAATLSTAASAASLVQALATTETPQ